MHEFNKNIPFQARVVNQMNFCSLNTFWLETLKLFISTGSRVAIIVQCAVGMGAGIIIAFTASWKLALVCMACMPFIVIGGKISSLSNMLLTVYQGRLISTFI